VFVSTLSAMTCLVFKTHNAPTDNMCNHHCHLNNLLSYIYILPEFRRSISMHLLPGITVLWQVLINWKTYKGTVYYSRFICSSFPCSCELVLKYLNFRALIPHDILMLYFFLRCTRTEVTVLLRTLLVSMYSLSELGTFLSLMPVMS
jgi:hypothetical protein